MSEIKYLIDTFGAVGWGALAIGLVAVLTLVRNLFASWDAVMLRFGIETKGSREKKEALGKIENLGDELQVVDVRLNEVDNQLTEGKERDKEISNKLSVLGQMLTEMQSRFDASERARIKDRISQGYRIYHKRGEWTEMEKEAFEGLIRDYEQHGGHNSFVHTICEPESATWKIIKE